MPPSFAIAIDAAKRVLRSAHLDSQAPKRLSQSFHNHRSRYGGFVRLTCKAAGYGSGRLRRRRVRRRGQDRRDLLRRLAFLTRILGGRRPSQSRRPKVHGSELSCRLGSHRWVRLIEPAVDKSHLYIKRSKLLAPVVVLILTISAIASVWLLVGRASSSRVAQLQVSSLRLSQADLQSAPFNADPTAGVELFASTLAAEQLYTASTLGAEQLYADGAPSAGAPPERHANGAKPDDEHHDRARRPGNGASGERREKRATGD
jgi:hypothetical protein